MKSLSITLKEITVENGNILLYGNIFIYIYIQYSI